ncbi:MAG: TIGR02391 family protein [Ferruginibacter sp.]
MPNAIRRPVLEAAVIESICKTIADTNDGLKGTEIGGLLIECKIKDIDPANTKWKRLYNAFVEWQNSNQCSNHILTFIQSALSPVRYVGKEELFHFRRHEVNKRLSFIGVELNERGKFQQVDKATTISEAQQRASHFKYKLEVRNVHPSIFEYCKPELLNENYFHSVFEAIKSIAERIRNMTGLYADGNVLIETAFATGNPLIKINLINSDTDRSEHLGLMNVIKGLFGLIRNPTAHEPKIKFRIEEDEALDLMIMVSYIHKRLDKAL